MGDRMFSGQAWQQRYALPDWKDRLTQLTPGQEQAFKGWVRQNHAPVTPDYDMRGFWMNGGSGAQVNPNDHMLHYPDTYKTPAHESFSGESIYANPSSNPPHWVGDRLIASDGTVIYDESRRR